MSVLVIAEHDHAQLKGATLNTVTAALQCDGDVHLLLAGHNASEAAKQASQIAGVAKVLHADAPQLGEQLAENIAAQVLAIANNYSHILFPATAHGKNVAPRVAAKLDVAQISDITKVDSADTFRSEEHTSELQSQSNLVCRLLLEKKKKKKNTLTHESTEERRDNDMTRIG